MRKTCVSVILLSGIIFLVGCGSETSTPAKSDPSKSSAPKNDPPPSDTGVIKNELYTKHCMNCHNGKAPNLSKIGNDPKKNATWIADHIKDPKSHSPNSKMPAFADKLKPEEIKSLSEYLAGLK